MNRSALLLLLPLLTGCNVHSKNPSNGDENVSIQADGTGKVAFDMPFANGSVKLPESMMAHGNIDIDGVKLMPASSVTGFNLQGDDKGSTVNMTFKASAPPDQVRSYYADQFRKQGVEVAVAGDTVSGTSKDGGPFTIQVTPDGSGSQGKIAIQDKD